jgi:hypothetical protein
VLEPRHEVVDVSRIEAHGGAEMDGLELAAFDEPLDRARVDVENVRGFARG